MTYDWHSRCSKVAHDGGFKREEVASHVMDDRKQAPIGGSHCSGLRVYAAAAVMHGNNRKFSPENGKTYSTMLSKKSDAEAAERHRWIS